MALDEAQEAFESRPSKETAATYLRAARDSFEGGMIEEETLLHAVQDVITWLESTP